MAPPRKVLHRLEYNTVVIGWRKLNERIYWRVEGPHVLFPNATLTHYAYNEPVFEVERARMLMAIKLGRPLESHEIVHHKNNNSEEDSEWNLELTTQAEHNKHHKTGTRHSEEVKEQIGRAVHFAYQEGRHRVTQISQRDAQGRILGVE